MMPRTRTEITQAEMDRAKSLLERPYMATHPEIKEEIVSLIETNMSAEMECILESVLRYMTQYYLPTKIRNSDWI
jgi:DNA topoisomerase VI subunit A